ncbi:MAG: hypothetical protein ACT452_08635 [Microthrixaceae bacterium]
MAPANVDPTTPEVSLALNPSSRRGYQITDTGSASLITAIDLDTLEPLRSLSVPWSLSSMGADGLDAEGGRIFLKANRPFLTGIAVLDEQRFAAGHPSPVTFLKAPTNPAYGTAMAAGLRYEPRTNKILLLLNPQRTGDSFLGLTRAKGVYANFLAQWDATTGAEDWLHSIRQCSTASINTEAGSSITPFLSKAGDAIYAMCGVSESELQMLRLPLSADGKPTGDAQTYPAGSGIAAVAIDPVRERVHMISSASYVLTYDWPTRRIAGTSGISSFANTFAIALPAVDVDTGRLVVASPPRGGSVDNQQPDVGGLFLIDGRRTDMPQALVFEDLAGPALRTPPVIDPAAPGRARRIFMRHALDTDANDGEAFFRVVSDPIPVSVDPVAGDPDPTADVDESELTESSFASEANGYGTRLLVVGGLQGPITAYEMGGKCVSTNREVIAASIQRAGLSSVAASARIHGVDADLGTQADLKDSSRCMNGGAGAIRYPAPPDQAVDKGLGWGFEAAECSGSDRNEAGQVSEGWLATAICEQAKERVSGSAHYSGVATAGISVSRSSAQAVVRRDPKLGVVAETTSVSEGIDIPGVGRIGSVTATAMSRASGRIPLPGDPARTALSVKICAVITDTFADQGCRSGADAAPMIAALNDAGRNRVFFRQPSAEKSLLVGSPGGYQAGIQRDRGEAALAKLENNDELLAVPALEMVFRTNPDGSVRRYIVQLAGVRTVSTYGIAVLPPSTMSTPEAEAIVAELGLDVNAGDGGAYLPVTKVATTPPSIVQQVLDAIADQSKRLYRTAFQVDLRSPGDIALALGVWMTLGTPLYLADRRRRYRRTLL